MTYIYKDSNTFFLFFICFYPKKPASFGSVMQNKNNTSENKIPKCEAFPFQGN